jgi:hypothetical protein
MTVVDELAEHARTHRFVMRAVAAVYCLILLVNVWDRSWWSALFAAAVVATGTLGSRSVTRTLRRLP